MQPLLTLDSMGRLTGGVTLPADAGVIGESGAAFDRFGRQVYDVAARKLPMSIAVSGLGEPDQICSRFDRLAEAVHGGLQRAGAGPPGAEFSIGPTAMLPGSLVDAYRRWPLAGTLSVHIDPLSISDAACWSSLHRAQRRGILRIAYATVAGTQCPLLPTEAANATLPGNGALVPVGTAWIAMRLDLARFADGGGTVDTGALGRALALAVETGDRLHDIARWPTARMRLDAWLNRRLAIMVDGVGHLLQRRKQDPCRFASLKELEQLLLWVRESMQQASRRLATDTDTLPVLDRADPSRDMPEGPVRDSWRERWADALRSGACRHRNLLALRPAGVLPRSETPDYRYSDLLPLLRLADVVCVSGIDLVARWNVSQFRDFHRRAFAALQQRELSRQIAEPI